jgi:uncharacterized protein (TIGR00730 family)
MENKKIVNLPTKDLNIVPLTRSEMHHAAEKRISLITKEFESGFEFIRHYPRSVTIFGGTRFKDDHPYYLRAKSIGKRIVDDLGYSVFTGGGPGIMEAANRGAYEAGGDSLGLTIELPDEQVINPYLSRHLGFYYFFSRKVCMTFSAEAYIFFPGGIGTLNEFFEILTLIQTHKIEKIPMILVCSDFWNPIDKMMKDELLSRSTIDKEDTNLYTITDDEEEIINIIKNAPVRMGIKFEHK